MTLLVFGTTSGAAAQEPTLSPDDLTWIPSKSCFCITKQSLAKTAYALKYAKLKLEIKDEELARRLGIADEGCKLRIDLTKEYYEAQTTLTKDSCAKQTKILIDQTETLVTDLTASYSKRLQDTAGLILPEKIHWYQHPAFWGVLGGAVGLGLGLGTGALIWK